MTTIKVFDDGTSLVFGRGSFDNWCICKAKHEGARRAPRDADYFRVLQAMAVRHGADTVYANFVEIYSRVTRNLQSEVLQLIEEQAVAFDADRLEYDVTLVTMYAAMVAEENRPLPLGKRIKRLGIHQLLIEDFTPDAAANFSRGRKARELDGLCSQGGF